MTPRLATAADAAAVLALEAAAFGVDGWSADSVAAELTAPTRYVVVAERGGGIVGWAVLLVGDPADVLRLAVLPGARRRGVGREVLGALLEHAGERSVLLEVEAGNSAARALYAAAGFTEIDRRPGYYGPGRDALVLSRTPVDTQERAPW